jgi:UDP-GlcNAc3NAcA epimerase
MKICTIVGARPQFIKAAAISRAIEVIVHTGQHYDDDMSAVFFRELEIPDPAYNLGIGSGTHGAQTGQMLAAIEEVLLRERPDWVLIYGDTNSTLAGALVAAKIHVRIAHVEAGLRSFNRHMPEEINRVVADHLSHLLLCPSQVAVNNLSAEGISKGVALVGDVMADALKFAETKASAPSDILSRLELQPQCYLLATVHRAENTDDNRRLQSVPGTSSDTQAFTGNRLSATEKHKVNRSCRLFRCYYTGKVGADSVDRLRGHAERGLLVERTMHYTA